MKPQTPHDETWKVKHAGRENANFLEVLRSDPEVAKHFKKGEPEEFEHLIHNRSRGDPKCMRIA
ncbi:MAG: hypothetical protein DMG10_27770 [Acidobacteria bacterium]|nr:MAG: hypothetical protein DMG10_27770 [Acidobacteriota bacterium]